jgi:hypothetical protein
MPGGDNAAIVAHFLNELWNNRNLAIIDQLTVQNYVLHIPQGNLVGREALKAVAKNYFERFSIIQVRIVDQTSQDSQVVTRIRWGTALKLRNQPLDVDIDRIIPANGVSLDRIDNGQIAESWNMLDTLYYLFNIQELSRNPAFVQNLLAVTLCDNGVCPLGQYCVDNNYCAADIGTQ